MTARVDVSGLPPRRAAGLRASTDYPLDTLMHDGSARQPDPPTDPERPDDSR